MLPTRAQAEKAAQNFYDLVKLYRQMESTMLEYMAHPKASANEIMRLRDKLVESRKYRREMHAHLEKHFDNLWSYEARQLMKKSC